MDALTGPGTGPTGMTGPAGQQVLVLMAALFHMRLQHIPVTGPNYRLDHSCVRCEPTFDTGPIVDVGNGTHRFSYRFQSYSWTYHWIPHYEALFMDHTWLDF